MNDDNDKDQEPLETATKATQQRCRVRLDELKLLPERFCHRENDELQEEKLETFMDSLILEGGVRVPIVIFTDTQKQKVVISGHRRVFGCRTLADRNQPGFSHDMEIDAIEVLGATPEDLLVQSVSDNENRKNLSPVSRLRTVKRLHDAGVESRRAARALGVDDKTYKRDLLIVQHAWMFQHVEDNNIAPTVATKLLEAAEVVKDGKKWIKEFKEDFDAWVHETRKTLKDEARRYHAATGGKEMNPAELEPKHRKNMPPHLVNHWLSLIKDRRRFEDEPAEWDFQATMEEGKLQMSGLNLDFTKEPAVKVVKVLGRLSQLIKQLTPLAAKCVQIERQREQTKTKEQMPPYDFDLLRNIGLNDMAEHLEERYRRKLASGTDGEEDADYGQIEERSEVDLTASIELPDSSSEPAKASVSTEEDAPPAPAKSSKDEPSAPKREGRSKAKSKENDAR